MTKYININDFKLKGIEMFDENLDILISLSDLRKSLQMIPAADVAPKSEVAREIFAEFKRLIAIYSYIDEYGKEVIGTDIEEEIDRLEKKYINEKTCDEYDEVDK